MATILIVDDEETERQAWRRTLESAGHEIVLAARAEDALELCDSHSFDVVILDYLMPSMRGTELLARIREKQRFVRSIIVSGQIDPGVGEEDLATQLRESVEVDDYLSKPLTNERLLSAITALTNRRAMEDQDWSDLAEAVVSRSKVTIKKARETSKQMDKLRTKKKPLPARGKSSSS